MNLVSRLFQLDRWSYTLTVRRPEVHGQVVEVKTQITTRDYFNMLEQRDPFHLTIYKKRRCFLYNNQYFQLDVYQEPCHPRYSFNESITSFLSADSVNLNCIVVDFSYSSFSVI